VVEMSREFSEGKCLGFSYMMGIFHGRMTTEFVRLGNVWRICPQGLFGGNFLGGMSRELSGVGVCFPVHNYKSLRGVAVVYNNNKKKIYNAHVVMNHESETRAVARWPDGVC